MGPSRNAASFDRNYAARQRRPLHNKPDRWDYYLEILEMIERLTDWFGRLG